MKRVLFALVGTIAGLVGLLSFKTESVTIAAQPAAVGTTGTGTPVSSTPTPAAGTSTGTAARKSSAKSSSRASTKSSGNSSTSAAPKPVTKTVTGDAADTPYGPVQLQVTLTNNKITKVTAVEYPNDPHSQEINSYAIPQLTQETLAADSAQIDSVSGATYTSQGYVTSLQSALNKAGV